MMDPGSDYPMCHIKDKEYIPLIQTDRYTPTGCISSAHLSNDDAKYYKTFTRYELAVMILMLRCVRYGMSLTY